MNPPARPSENDFLNDAAKRFESAFVPTPAVPPVAKAPVAPESKPVVVAPVVGDKAAIADIGNAAPIVPVQDDPPDEPAASPRAPDWAKLKESRNTFRKQAEEYQRKISELEKKAPTAIDATELESLKKQNEDYQKRLQVLAVERDPQFEAHFGGRTKQALDYVKQSVPGENGEKLHRLLSQPDSEYRTAALEEAISGLSHVEQSKIGAVMVQLDTINADRQAQIDKASETYKAIQSRQQQATQANQKQLTDAMNSVVERARDPKSGMVVFQERQGDEAWNTEVKQRIGLVNHILTGRLSPEDLAKAATWSAAAPALLQEVKTRDSEIAALRKQISDLSAANPDPSRGKGEMPAAAPDKNMSMADAVNLKVFGRTK